MGASVVNHHARHKKVRHVFKVGQERENRLAVILSVSALLTITAWSYWPTTADLFDAWQRNDDYSAGQLVPLVAAFLVWRDWKTLRKCLPIPCWWGGITLLLLAETARIYGFLSFRSSPERYSLVLTVAGLVLMVAGWQVFRRVLWILLFLFLMVPLPGRVHNLISPPLQSIATTGAVVLLEAFGTPVGQQGNVVTLNENMPIAVAEACSGLRMLMAFIIVAAFVAYMVKRPRWQKAVLLASSIPAALVCNILRIFATAMLMLYVSAEVAQKFFHDFAGYVMMPAAVVLLFGELWLMNKLVVHEPKSQQKPTVVRAQSPKRAAARPQTTAINTQSFAEKELMRKRAL